MKRRDLLQMVALAARIRGLSWKRIREGAAHEVWGLDGRRITIPRHREINEVTARAILRGFEQEFGKTMVGDVRASYTATAERRDGWWAIRVVELPGVFSQARRLDRVEGMARDAIALLLDIDPGSFDVAVRQVLSDEAERAVTAAIQARAEAQERQERASAASREAVRILTRLGLPQRDIGRLLGLSHQRIGQLSDG